MHSEAAGRLGAGAKTLTPVTLPGDRLRREAVILQRLGGIGGVPVLLEPCDGTCLPVVGHGRPRAVLPGTDLTSACVAAARPGAGAGRSGSPRPRTSRWMRRSAKGATGSHRVCGPR
ncbi:hypothetical protein ACQP2P_37050 [Dactylosporangium sp. CA-139114]|uniref:hypothetical protein n=1 Tax=Dactylosporangium sp. CA-139114 TaxID=3239931 RepID=UPI003D995533